MNNKSGDKNQQAKKPMQPKQPEQQPNPKSRQKSGGHTGSKDAGNSDDAPSKGKNH